MKDLIRKFCGDEDDREWTRNPWTTDKYIRATNGHIAIELDKDKFAGIETVNIDHKYPEFNFAERVVRTFFPIHVSAFHALDLPGNQAERFYKYPKCNHCGGSGECTDCDCGTEHYCGYCNGSGENKKLNPKERIKQKRIPFYSTSADWKYLDLVRQSMTLIPESWEIGLPENPLEIITFRRPSVTIYLMPMRDFYETI